MKWLKGTVLALLVALSAPAFAGHAKIGSIEIAAAWARATPGNGPAGGAYVSIINHGEAADNLVGVTTSAAKTAEIHTHMSQGDTMRMIALSSVEIPAGRTIDFAPGGLHIMLIGLAQPLKDGASFPMVLEFAQAGKVTVTVDVLSVGAMGPGAMAHDPAMHQQHMQDPDHRKMHDAMHPAQK